MRVRLDPEAYLDLADISEYYDREGGEDVVARFEKELEHCYRQIEERGKAFPIFRGNVRRLNFRRFPYHISIAS